jgi:hypothetical protein
MQYILDHSGATKAGYDQQARFMVFNHLRQNVPRVAKDQSSGISVQSIELISISCAPRAYEPARNAAVEPVQ